MRTYAEHRRRENRYTSERAITNRRTEESWSRQLDEGDVDERILRDSFVCSFFMY